VWSGASKVVTYRPCSFSYLFELKSKDTLILLIVHARSEET
jgi:hypothetical protein